MKTTNDMRAEFFTIQMRQAALFEESLKEIEAYVKKNEEAAKALVPPPPDITKAPAPVIPDKSPGGGK